MTGGRELRDQDLRDDQPCDQKPGEQQPMDEQAASDGTTSSSVMTRAALNLEDLPNELGLMMLRRVRLYELLCIMDKVSPDWIPLQEEALRGRHSLTLRLGYGTEQLLLSSDWLDKIDHHNGLIYAGWLRRVDVDLLLAKLPRIKRLVIGLGSIEPDEVDQVVRLLRAWRHQLTDLNIACRYHNSLEPPNEATSREMLRLLAAINCIKTLKIINFWVDGHLLPENAGQQSLYLPFMAYSKFTFRWARLLPTIPNVLLDSWDRFYGHNTDPFASQINTLTNEDGARVLRFKPEVAGKISVLSCVYWTNLDQPQLSRLCMLFHNLETITIQVTADLSLVEVAQGLRSLKKLTCLRLKIHDLQEQVQAMRDPFPLEDGTILPALSTVTQLVLHVSTLHSHEDLEALHLEQMVPNLEKLIICGDCIRCNLCGDFGEPHGRFDRVEDKDRVVECIRLATEKLRGLFPRPEQLEITSVSPCDV